MFDLKTIAKQTQSLNKQTNQRHNQANSEYQKGVVTLQQYVKNPQRSLLLEAIQHLMQASRFNRLDPLPYVLLGRVYWSMELKALALRFLRAAQSLSPDLPAVVELCELLTSGKSPQKWQPGLSSVQSDELDYDALYDELEAHIQSEVQTVMNIRLPLHPTWQQDVILDLDESLQKLKQTELIIQENLQIVDQEIDTAELKQLMRPLFQRLKQIEMLYQHCLLFAQIWEVIYVLKGYVEERLGQDLIDDEGLEAALDQCDSLADQLDDLAQKGLAVGPLEKAYEEMTQKLAIWQEQLE